MTDNLSNTIVKRTVDGATFETDYRGRDKLVLEAVDDDTDDRTFTLERFMDRLEHGGYYIPDFSADMAFRNAAEAVLDRNGGES